MEMLTVKARNPDDVALWTKRITDCKNSGLRPGEWCAENGINVKTYYYWHNKIHKLVNQQTESLRSQLLQADMMCLLPRYVSASWKQIFIRAQMPRSLRLCARQ